MRGGAKKIPGVKSCWTQPVGQLMPNAHALVTHGSYISVDALLHGVPSIILGPMVTRPISSTSLAEIERPRLATDEERLQVLANFAWTQYTLPEIRKGWAWAQIKRLFLS